MTALPQLSAEARYLAFYRENPSAWARHKLKVQLARYRDRSELEAWLATQEPDTHTWCRERLAQGQLTRDGSQSYQADALDAMAAPGWYALQWCNGAAKTATAAMFVHWFLDCWPGGRCVSTAGTWSQLKEQLWREIAIWGGRAAQPIAANFAPEGIGKTQVDIAPDWAAFGRAADQGATFEGAHAPHVLVLMDEAKAIKPEIFDSVRRILRGNPAANFWWVCLSSPGSPTGPFYDITNGEQAHRWNVLRMSAYESERVDLGLVERDAADLGEQSPLFISMDLGEFPDEADDTIIPLSLAQSAVGREVDTNVRAVLAVDVARLGGDETVFGEFEGRKFTIPLAYTGKRITETAGQIKTRRGRYGVIGVDDGGVGGGVVDICLENDIDVVALNAGARAHDKHYFNLGSQMAFNLRRELELGAENPGDPSCGLSLPADKRLLHQLSARKSIYRSNGQLMAESKVDMRKRGEKSPDRADNCSMANYLRGHQRLDDDLEANLRDQHTILGRRSNAW